MYNSAVALRNADSKENIIRCLSQVWWPTASRCLVFENAALSKFAYTSFVFQKITDEEYLFIYLCIYLFITRVKYNKLRFVFIIHSLHYKTNPAEENIFLFAGPAYLKTNLKLVLIWLVNGIFHGKSAAQNFKSSETWLNLFKIMEKTQKPIFRAIYANVEKLL